MIRFRRALVLWLSAAVLSAPALATWSIVVVNRATGEVGVASATCLVNLKLRRLLAVLAVGRGAGAAQSLIDNSGANRRVIWDGFHAGTVPERILDLLAGSDSGHQTRQYGIVSFDGPPVTFTGTMVGKARFGVTGEVGDLLYAIQGNVLAGDAVVLAAEQALRDEDGDMVARIMAGMEAARFYGGDGRCSCSQSTPDGCGSPPPNFSKSAHTAFIVVARPGDADGVCESGPGCANGKYYLLRESIGGLTDPDPVLDLQVMVDIWRQKQIGRPDHVLSDVVVDRQQLVADGRSRAGVRILLRDIEGTPLGHGNDIIRLVRTSPGAPTALVGPVTDHGDGSYSFDLTATTRAGHGEWNVWVDYSKKVPRLLYPPLTLDTSEVTELHSGVHEYRLSEGGTVPFTLNLGAGQAGRAYLLLGSTSGTQPGFDLRGLRLPLNPDRFLRFTFLSPNSPQFSRSAGLLDGEGRAEALLSLAPATWASLVGEQFDFVAFLGGPSPAVTNVVGFFIVP